MPLLGTQAQLGTAIATAIKNQRPDPIAEVSDAQLIAIWTAVSNEIINHFIANTVVNTQVNGATGSGPSGGPLPIANQPGVGVLT